MIQKEHRKDKRLDSLNLTYVCVDDHGSIVQKSMGRTLNVSESGICLETHFSIDTSHFLTVTIALENKLVDIKGTVAFSRPGQEGKFETGVKFIEVDQQSRVVLHKFIELFKSIEAS
ncbi:MAG: PilZ domain-containing protein [Desulfuromonadaceae bacterium]